MSRRTTQHRARSIRTRAIVLRQHDFAEADRLLVLFTPVLGKVRAVAKGVRRITSRKAGHLEQYQLTDLLLARGRDLYVVTQAEVINPFRAIREDLTRVSYVSYCLELLDQFAIEDEEAQPVLFNFLVDALTWLETTPDLALTTRYFELSLLNQMGYRPELEVCVQCGKTIAPEDQYFSVTDGGVVCPSDGPTLGGAVPLSLAALKVLRFLQRSPYDALQKLKLKDAVAHELETLMQRYVSAIFERQPRSMAFIRQVRRKPTP